MKQILSGGFLCLGAMIVGGLKIAGVGGPSSGTAYSSGSNDGFWIGTGIGFVMGLGMIAQGVIARKKTNADENAQTLAERLSTIELSRFNVAVIMLILFFVTMAGLVLFYPGFGQ